VGRPTDTILHAVGGKSGTLMGLTVIGFVAEVSEVFQNSFILRRQMQHRHCSWYRLEP
jgi:hypothetical protein